MTATYRVGGKMEWCACSGQAIIALQNFGGSNRKVTVRRIDVDILTSCQGASGSILRGSQFALIKRGVMGDGGDPVAIVPNDTNSAALPAQVTAWSMCGLSSTESIGRVLLNRNFSALGSNDLAAMNQHGRMSTTLGRHSKSSPNLESFTIREGQCLGLVAADDRSTIPLEVSADIRVGTRSYAVRAYTTPLCDGVALLAINNAIGSGVVVEVHSISVSELGSIDTPYLQVVPVGTIDPAALVPANRLTPIKNDTDSPTLDTAKVAAFQNVAILPQGVPQQYIQESSVGTPKGYNYLHTKDFAGPVYRVFFPELRVGASGLLPDGGEKFLKQVNLLGTQDRGGIVLRPGEGIAVCSAAENATGSIVGVSAWTSLEIWLTLTDEPIISPSLTLTGLATGTVVAVVQAGTETLIEVLAESAGSVTFDYDAAPGTFVDINLLAAGKVWQQLADFELTEAVQSIPVAQVDDVVYLGSASEAVTFNGSAKRIVCDSGNTSLDVQALYSEWVDWALLGSNLRFLPAFFTQGGTDIDPGAGTQIAFYTYLINGWRVRPQEANHTLAVTGGILLVDGGGDPFVNTLSAFTVRINYQQPVQAITVATGGGGGGGGATAAEVWDYADRSLTASGVTAIQTGLATSATAAAIQAKTDNIPSDPADQSLLASAIAAVPAAVIATPVDGAYTLGDVSRILAAVAAGKTSGQPTAPVFRDLNDTVNRVTGTVDTNGNRTAVTVNP
jgi:hypothetical protein